MRSFLRRKLAGLGGCTSGNAAILVALGLPMLVGGAGLGVDLAQWYTWKRELQYAADQAAIAGAWARAADEDGDTYITRATQEYNASISMTADFDSGPTVTLEDYDGGVDNSIQVVASATSDLPFTNLLTGTATTVSVRAQAIYEPGATYRPCMMALDPDDPNAFWMNGNVTVQATCGIGALSNDDDAILKDGGSGDIDVGFAVTAGGINDEHGHLDDDEVTVEGVDYLEDPFAGLEPPDNPTTRSLSCATGGNGKYTADESVTITTTYAYFKGKNKNNLTSYNHPSPKPTSTSGPTVTIGKEFNTAPSNSTVAAPVTLTEISGGGNDTLWEEASPTVSKTYSNIVAPQTTYTAQPGTYTSFNIACDTVLAPGVYVLDGALLSIAAQTKLSGTGVMLVLKNGAGFQVSGGSEINLTAMTSAQLSAAGVADEDLSKMLGMLIFEDPESPGRTGNTLTGNSEQILNGIVYTPNSGLHIAGTPAGTSQCMVLATKTLKISGTTDISTLCPTGITPTHAMAETQDVVRLVG